MLECRSPFYKVCKSLFIQHFNILKTKKCLISAILSLSDTLKILYTALFIRLFSIINFSYTDPLQRLQLQSLELRRLVTDLIGAVRLFLGMLI